MAFDGVRRTVPDWSQKLERSPESGIWRSPADCTGLESKIREESREWHLAESGGLYRLDFSGVKKGVESREGVW